MRLFTIAGALGAVLLMGSATFAQVPPDPNNPNENIPDALTPMPYGEPINIETAKKAAAAAIAEAQKRNWNAFCIAIVGPSGDLVYFEKQDNCQYAVFRNKRRARRHGTGAQRWYTNGCSARVTFMRICPHSEMTS
jgi:glc operon protein GlcG